MTAPQEKPRYFYSDPLAAAWMMKHHGVRLCNEATPIGFGTFSDLGLFESDNPLDIHPDSLHLLEPQVGDLYELVESRPLRKVTEAALGDEPYSSHVSGHLLRKINCVWSEGMRLQLTSHWPTRWPNLQYTVIQRNGLAFHWPESDGA